MRVPTLTPPDTRDALPADLEGTSLFPLDECSDAQLRQLWLDKQAGQRAHQRRLRTLARVRRWRARQAGVTDKALQEGRLLREPTYSLSICTSSTGTGTSPVPSPVPSPFAQTLTVEISMWWLWRLREARRGSQLWLTALVILHWRTQTQRTAFWLSATDVFPQLEISRYAMRRALRRLEALGLIRVWRRRGRMPWVTILTKPPLREPR